MFYPGSSNKVPPRWNITDILSIHGFLKLISALALMALAGACATTKGQGGPPPSPISMTEQSLPPQSFTPVSHAPAPQMPPPEAFTGSLWSGQGGSLYRDIKARNVGDILTILVSEESRASKSAQTGTSRNRTLSGGASFGGITWGGQDLVPSGGLNAYEAEFGSAFRGQGSTAKKESLMAYMTATVVDILPNGNLFIRGSRWTRVNNEMQQIVLEGVVRPNDVTRNNSVLSQNIADAKIFFEGKGPITQHQRPGWLLQLMDLVSPF